MPTNDSARRFVRRSRKWRNLHIAVFLRAQILIVFCAALWCGCSANPRACSSDADCDHAETCRPSGGVFFSSGVCVGGGIPSIEFDAGDAGNPDVQGMREPCDASAKEPTPEQIAAFCGDEGAECGELSVQDDCGREHTITCGTCPRPQRCVAGECTTETGDCGDHDCRTFETCVEGAEGYTCEPPSDGELGHACETDADCEGVGRCLIGPNYHRGICAVPCGPTNRCPAQTVCAGTLRGPHCFPTCEADDDCRSEGYACAEINQQTQICAPSGTGSAAVGDACETLDSCAGGLQARCVPAADDTDICTLRCDDAFPCPDAFECTNGPEMSPPDNMPSAPMWICLERCVTDEDCDQDLICFDGDGDGERECRPDIGKRYFDTCESSWECAGREYAACVDLYGSGDRHCTMECSNSMISADCGESAHCVEQYCRLECVTEDDCPDDVVCVGGTCGD
jgi:hypothetical protein